MRVHQIYRTFTSRKSIGNLKKRRGFETIKVYGAARHTLKGPFLAREVSPNAISFKTIKPN